MAEIGGPGHGRIPVTIQNEVIHELGRDDIDIIELRNHPWLKALSVVYSAYRTREACLRSRVAADAELNFLAVADVVIHATGNKIFRVHTRGGRSKCHCAGRIHAKLRPTCAIDIPAGERLLTTAEMPTAVLKRQAYVLHRHGAAYAWGCIVELEQALIDRQRGGRNMRQDVSLQIRRGERNNSVGRKCIT
jgi:hypothetical protein